MHPLTDDRRREQEAPFPLWGYLALNAFVWALSLAFLLAVNWIVGDITGILFFSIILPVGFGAVSVLDALYDRTRPRNEPPGASNDG